MTCCTALAPIPPEPEPMSHAEREAAVVLSYVEQRDAALKKIEKLKDERDLAIKACRLNSTMREHAAQERDELQKENAALRLASQAAAAHRKALEQLVSDCLAHMAKEPEEMAEAECQSCLYGDECTILFRDDWQHERLSLERRFVKLTTQEG